MERIGIRELRQHASLWLRRVQRGESFEVTDRGRPVAMLVPFTEADPLDRLIAGGEVTPARGDLLERIDPEPPAPGVPLPSELLGAVRAGER